MEITEWSASLKKQIADINDKPLFDEIVGCMQHDFLRSAYVMSWIGIAENLKRKISESANLGDKQAEAAIKEIEDAESKKQSVDKIILEKAEKLNLIDTPEFTTLEYLWTQRCLYAHPYQKAPNEGETTYIVSKLVEICLSQPLQYKKGFLTEWVQTLSAVPYFLANDSEKINQYYASILPRVAKNLHPFLFKSLLARLGDVIDDPTKENIKIRLRAGLLMLLATTETPLSDPNWTLEDKVTKYPNVVFYGIISVEVWKKLPVRIKDMLVDYALGEPGEANLITIKSWLTHLIIAGVLEPAHKTKYMDKLDKTTFAYAINFYADIQRQLNRMIAELRTNDYNLQSEVFAFIQNSNGQALLKTLNEDQQVLLAGYLSYAIQRGSWAGGAYLRVLTQQADLPPMFAYGFLKATIVDLNGNFGIDFRLFPNAVALINELQEPYISAVFARLAADIAAMGDKRHYIQPATLDAAKDKLSEVKPTVKIAFENALDSLKAFLHPHEDLPF